MFRPTVNVWPFKSENAMYVLGSHMIEILRLCYYHMNHTGKIQLSSYTLTLSYRTTHIQGDSGGICITLGNDSMSDSKQKSSYEHGSDFERLRSYGHFLIPVNALM